MEPNGKQTPSASAKPGLLVPPNDIPLTLSSFNYVAPNSNPCNEDKSSATVSDPDKETAGQKLNQDMKALYLPFSAEEDQEKRKVPGEDRKKLCHNFHANKTQVHGR